MHILCAYASECLLKMFDIKKIRQPPNWNGASLRSAHNTTIS